MRRISGTLTSVSTLFTAVGRPNRPMLHREGRLVARLRAAALDRLEQGGLLAHDVGAGADPQLDVEGPAGAQHVVAQQAGRARLADRVLQPLARQRVLAAEVQVAARGADGEALDRHRLDERERILLEDEPVLERPRLGLVGVAHDVARRGRLRRDGGPLATGGERGPAATDELRGGDLLDDRLRAELDARARAPRSRRRHGTRRATSDRRGRPGRAAAAPRRPPGARGSGPIRAARRGRHGARRGPGPGPPSPPPRPSPACPRRHRRPRARRRPARPAPPRRP